METTTNVGARQLRVCTSLRGDRPPPCAETLENPSRPRGAAGEGCGGRSQTSLGPCVWGGHREGHWRRTLVLAPPAPGEDTDHSTPVIHSQHAPHSPVGSEGLCHRSLPTARAPPRPRARRGRPRSVPARCGRSRSHGGADGGARGGGAALGTEGGRCRCSAARCGRPGTSPGSGSCRGAGPRSGRPRHGRALRACERGHGGAVDVRGCTGSHGLAHVGTHVGTGACTRGERDLGACTGGR